ncbi:hypothetical protein HHK36_027302 [Tetracentron sinense]|uniref:Uncharacterized protein n=1 Tax=Tetracentron sinense TaxID=13715 RepID=A0A834YIC4_TETSI|nr:hypothetical protein HHK36_027302 [Tetracentron sinense]
MEDEIKAEIERSGLAFCTNYTLKSPDLVSSWEVYFLNRSWPELDCRFMYDRIEDKFNSLEIRIRRHATAFVASGLYEDLNSDGPYSGFTGDLFVPRPFPKRMMPLRYEMLQIYNIDATTVLIFHNQWQAYAISEKSVFSVGMVCCDGKGHLNEKSILLQGRERVVAIEGNNPSGHCLIASKVVDSIPVVLSPDVGMPPAKKEAIDQEIQPSPSNSLTELSLVIAAGSFTTTDNLLFEPLVEPLANASRKQPQLVVMVSAKIVI